MKSTPSLALPIALIGLFFSAVSLQTSHGEYQVLALTLYCLIAILLPVGMNFVHRKGSETIGEWLAYALLFYECYQQFGRNYFTAPKWDEWLTVMKYLQNGSLLAVVSLAFPPVFHRICRKLSQEFLVNNLFAFLFLVVGFSYLLIVKISPQPPIDVWYFGQEGAQALFRGKNPYDMEYSNIYGPGAGLYPGDKAIYQPYPPASVLLSGIGYLFGDCRFSTILAHLLAVAMGFYALRKSGAPYFFRFCLPMLFLFSPRIEYGLEMAWTDPLVVGALSLYALGPKANRGFAGFALALKQTMAIFFVHSVIWKRMGSFRGIVFWLLPALVFTVPFLLWNPLAIYEDLVWFHLKSPFRPDALTVSSFFYYHFGVEPPAWMGGVGIGLGLLFSLFTKKLQTASCYWMSFSIVYLIILLTAKHAFFNYYYFHFFLLWLAAVTALTESDSH